ncbi:UBX domain-containing protein 6 [Chrysoperla carnea]|uniref:UBX domain-containing protein 6 n=1 Tax=Chrysoperla carnea TaxID=189513 RepID=UPI001D0753E9|nr:UBX domain-containing protein 6 [Chrysoperla carnea]XP_044737299.1 UBX domain-containing protein 6 [Chrysoperla carnea]
MAEKIKNFFKKKKSDAKFKLAGPGHKLTESTTSFDKPTTKNQYTVKPRNNLSEEARRAAEAAEARLQSKQQQDKNFNTSFAAIQAQVKRELEAEKKATSERKSSQSPVLNRAKSSDTEVEISPVLAVNGVYFKCPMVGPEILSKEEWRKKIREFLYAQLEFEQGLTAALMIHNLNKNREKISICVDTLCKYLENIVNNPTEEKYQRIRMSNRVFSEKVLPMEGALNLLLGAGFIEQNLTIDDKEEKYLVFSQDRVENLDTLRALCDALRSAEPIPLELDRNLQVLSPSQAAKRTELPTTFYALTPEEIKREQQLRLDAVEKAMQLRTKVMREKDELREIKKYKFALIRIRFPDGLFLQGTFAVFEKLVNIYEFVRDNLEYEDMPFILSNATGQKLNDEEEMEKTLVDLRLVPASILTFQWDPAVQDELSASPRYLKHEILMLVQAL